MKGFAVIVFVLAVFGSLDAQPGGPSLPAVYQRADIDIAEEIQQVIDKVWSFLPTEIGIKDFEISLPSNFLFGGNFRINNFLITGFKALDKKVLKFDPATSQLDYEFNFENIEGSIDYAFTIKGIFNIDHHFIFKADLKDLTTKGHAVVKMEDGHLKQITDFQALVTLDGANFNIEGFLNNEKLSKEVETFLNKTVAPLIGKLGPLLSPIVSKFIETIINIALSIFGQ